MFSRVLGMTGVVAMVLVSGAAEAVPVPVLQLLDAPVSYRADYAFSAAGHDYPGVVVHAPGEERRDFQVGKSHEILLLNRARNEAAILWPDKKFYIASSFLGLAAMVGGLDHRTVDRRENGHETVASEPTTRYAVTGDFAGTVWMTADGIVMKMDGVVTFQGHTTPFALALRNLHRAKADPALFQRPADYFGLPLDPGKFELK